MADITREDIRELKSDFKEGLSGLREALQGIGEKLETHAGKFEKHALEDADREGRVAAELSTVRTKLESLSDSTNDRFKFARSWLGALLVTAIAGAAGYFLRGGIH